MKMLTFLLFMGLLPTSAHANEDLADERARDYYENGREFYQKGSYAEALVMFETAYQLSGRATLLRSIGYCYEKMGRHEDALNTFKEWMLVGEADKMPEIERHIHRLVKIITADLEAEANTPNEAPPAPAPTPVPEPVVQAQPKTPEPKATWRISTGPTVLYGFATASAIAGTVMAVQAGFARNEAADNCSTGDAVFCQASASSSIRRDGLFSTIADASFGTTGVALVGATIWMIVDNRPAPVFVEPTLNGIRLGGQF